MEREKETQRGREAGREREKGRAGERARREKGKVNERIKSKMVKVSICDCHVNNPHRRELLYHSPSFAQRKQRKGR